MLIWFVRWYNIQSPILHDHTEVGGHARANSEGGGVDLGCSGGSIGSSCSFSIWAKNPLLFEVVKLGECEPQLLGDCANPRRIRAIRLSANPHMLHGTTAFFVSGLTDF